MKAVMISIRPEWCEKIALDFKTIEVRKSMPKLQPPFKCYIYCTKDKHGHLYRNDTGSCREIPLLYIKHNAVSLVPKGCINGTVVGEFVCDYILDIRPPYGGKTEGTCLEAKELYTYAGERSLLYGWHISDLVIYDKPKELSEFRRVEKTKTWAYPQQLTRPPQSWCYVEDME